MAIVAATASPAAKSSIPSVAIRLVPKRWTSVAESEAETIIAPA